MFKAVVGHGIDPDSDGAIEEALAQCKAALAGDVPQTGLLFAAIDFEHEVVIRRIRQTYPNILLIGGTSVGEMSSAMGFQEDSLTLMLFCSDEVTFQVGVGKQASEDIMAASRTAIAQATSARCLESGAESIKLCYALGDGLLLDGVAMVNGLKDATNQKIPIVGGLTADDWRFKESYQFISTPDRTEILQNSIVLLTFAGNLKVAYSAASGQNPIGPKATVTKSKGNTVYEIDGQPTQNFYTGTSDSTSDSTDIALSHRGGWSGALAVYEPNAAEFYLRAPNGSANADGSLSYFGQIAEQSTVQLVEVDNDALLNAAKDAFQTTLSTYPGKSPAAALIVSCGSRVKALGSRINQEYTLAAECLGDGIPIVGFHSFGEISPFAAQTTAHFHNETFTALLIGTH